MEILFDGSDMVNIHDLTGSKKKDESIKYFFDDESLENILYGASSEGPTLANLYVSAQHYIHNIIHAYEEGHIQQVIDISSEFGRSGHSISIGMCHDLVQVLKQIIPNRPNPILEFDLSPLMPLLEQIWKLALETNDYELQETLGEPAYRWYEHNGNYEEARQILTRLIEMHHQNGNLANKAAMVNNFAFEYLLEGKWEKAIPLFEDVKAK